jgi:hypothetical protein
MSDVAIRVEGLDKKYRLGLTHHRTIREAVRGATGKLFRRQVGKEQFQKLDEKRRQQFLWPIGHDPLRHQPLYQQGRETRDRIDFARAASKYEQ